MVTFPIPFSPFPFPAPALGMFLHAPPRPFASIGCEKQKISKVCSDAPWGGRMFHSVVEANGAMYLLGGSNGLEKLNDVWVSTDGR